MRKTVIMLMMLCIAPMWAAAQSFEGLMERYGPNEGVVTVTMSKSVLQRIARRDDNELLRKLTELKVISASFKCCDPLREAFLKDADRYAEGFDNLYKVSMGSDGSVLSVYVDSKCRKALMLSVEADAVLLMEMVGDIDGQMQDALLNNEIRIK
ncbi:MAG TPA: DUF4252 domain-containing protein [Candidatus Coprenecus merdigallinarum]|nr:DUF4252 domain-containing protein [Candidatus Coprenecus merdigallinarum]